MLKLYFEVLDSHSPSHLLWLIRIIFGSIWKYLEVFGSIWKYLFGTPKNLGCHHCANSVQTVPFQTSSYKIWMNLGSHPVASRLARVTWVACSRRSAPICIFIPGIALIRAPPRHRNPDIAIALFERHRSVLVFSPRPESTTVPGVGIEDDESCRTSYKTSVSL